MRELCRFCGAKLKHDKTSDQYDPEYCSGLCRKKDGSESYVKTAQEKAMVVVATKEKAPASLEDYKKQGIGKYARRFEPEKLNWSKNEMNEEELQQAGFRANRKPIPGDWDYVEGREFPDVRPPDIKPLNDWDLLRAKARELGIHVHGRKREEIEAEIKEKEND